MLFDTPGLPPPTIIAAGSAGAESKKRKRPSADDRKEEKQKKKEKKQHAAHGAEANLGKLMKKMGRQQQSQGQQNQGPDSGWGQPLGGKSKAKPAVNRLQDADSDVERQSTDGNKKKKQKKAKGDMFAVGGGGIVGPVSASSRTSAASRRQDASTSKRNQTQNTDSKTPGKTAPPEQSSPPPSSAKPSPLRHAAPNHAVDSPSSTSASVKPTGIQASLRAKLAGGKFRMLNETLYTSSGADAYETMREEGNFDDYHAGFRSQAANWPVQPLALITSQLQAELPSRSLVADFGCGDAQLARDLASASSTADLKVISFDLVSKDGYVIEAECSSVPLPGSSLATGGGQIVDAVVCCLSLMGTDWIEMVREARRVLVPGGLLKIAEVSSRFTDLNAFIELVEAVGFELANKDTSNTHFVMFDFTKSTSSAHSTAKTTELGQPKLIASNTTKAAALLKPCIYKKR